MEVINGISLLSALSEGPLNRILLVVENQNRDPKIKDDVMN